jgi:hypothetical protein
MFAGIAIIFVLMAVANDNYAPIMKVFNYNVASVWTLAFLILIVIMILTVLLSRECFECKFLSL